MPSLRTVREVDASVNILTADIQAAVEKASFPKPTSIKRLLANLHQAKPQHQKPHFQQVAKNARSESQTPIKRTLSSNPRLNWPF